MTSIFHPHSSLDNASDGRMNAWLEQPGRGASETGGSADDGEYTATTTKIYADILKSCRWQKGFSWYLLLVFFALQYSVPILLVVLGSIAGSREQLIKFITPSDVSSSKVIATSMENRYEALVSRIIYLVGIVTILLGVINNIVRPAESYDICARYNNKFYRFEREFQLDYCSIKILRSAGNACSRERLLIRYLLEKMLSCAI